MTQVPPAHAELLWHVAPAGAAPRTSAMLNSNRRTRRWRIRVLLARGARRGSRAPPGGPRTTPLAHSTPRARAVLLLAAHSPDTSMLYSPTSHDAGHTGRRALFVTRSRPHSRKQSQPPHGATRRCPSRARAHAPPISRVRSRPNCIRIRSPHGRRLHLAMHRALGAATCTATRFGCRAAAATPSPRRRSPPTRTRWRGVLRWCQHAGSAAIVLAAVSPTTSGFSRNVPALWSA